MIDAIDNDKSAYNVSHWSHGNAYSRMECVYHNSAKLLQTAGFSDEEKDDYSDNPFSALKYSIEQLQSRDETLIPDNISLISCFVWVDV